MSKDKDLRQSSHVDQRTRSVHMTVARSEEPHKLTHLRFFALLQLPLPGVPFLPIFAELLLVITHLRGFP